MKMKTRKIAAKRFKVTKTGLLMRRRQNARHLRLNKSGKQIRRYRKSVVVSKTQERRIRKMLPYS